MDREVLLLNSCEQVLKIISWKKAVKLLLTGKAIKPLTPYKKTYRIKTAKGNLKIPAAIVLLRFYELPDIELKPTRRNILKRDNYTCQYCGLKTKNQKNLTIDHVHPKCKGGDNGWTNLVTACRECNSKKGNSLLKECEFELIKKPKKPKYYALHLTGLDEKGKKLWSRWINV
jgi:hypothetical protein